MKNINAPFEDAVFEQIEEVKDKSGLSWPDFIVAAAAAYERQERCKDDGR